MVELHTQKNISYVYLLINDEFLKIGKADSQSRISQMHYLYNFRLQDSYIIKVDTTQSSVLNVEKMLHKLFHNYRYCLEVIIDGSSELFKPEVLEMVIEAMKYNTKYMSGVDTPKKLIINKKKFPSPSKKVKTLYEHRSNHIDYSEMVSWLF